MQMGFGAVEESIKRSEARSASSGFLPTITWRDDRDKGGEEYQKTLRFLTDDIIVCKIYEYIKCPDGKLRDFIVPSSVDVEGPDYVKESGIKVQAFGSQEMVEPKPRELVLGIAAVRKEVQEVVNGRRVLRFKDATEEVEVDGEVREQQVFGLIKQSPRTFWNQLAAYYGRYGTITDRDYTVQRRGNGIDTRYVFMAEDPIEGLREPEEISKAYQPPVELVEYVKMLASPKRARKFLYGEEESDESKAAGEEEAKNVESEETKNVEAEENQDFSELKERLLSQK